MGLLTDIGGALTRLGRLMLAPAEDPRDAGSSPFEHQQDLLEQVRLARQQVGAARRRLQALIDRLASRSGAYQEQARAALAAGQDEAARGLLRQRRAVEAQIEALRNRVAVLSEEARTLGRADQQLSTLLEALRSEQEADTARYEVQRRVGGILDQMSASLGRLDAGLKQSPLGREPDELDLSALDRLTGMLEVTAQELPDAARDDDEIEFELRRLRFEAGAQT